MPVEPWSGTGCRVATGRLLAAVGTVRDCAWSLDEPLVAFTVTVRGGHTSAAGGALGCSLDELLAV